MIAFLETIKSYILQLDEKTFFAYLGGFLLSVILIISGIFYYYYSSTHEFIAELDELNEQRQEVRTLFETAARVKKQEIAVDKLLKEDEGFKIGAYFKKVLDTLNMSDKVPEQNFFNVVEQEGKYRETTLTARFQMVDMKQICEVLNEIESNQRVYTKSIEIVRSKVPNKLNVTLSIGTLDLKTVPGT